MSRSVGYNVMAIIQNGDYFTITSCPTGAGLIIGPIICLYSPGAKPKKWAKR